MLNKDSQDVVELSGLGTNTNVVQQRVTLLVAKLGRGTLSVESLLDGSEVLVGGSSRSAAGSTLFTELRIST